MKLRDNSERARTIINIFYFFAFVIIGMFISNLMQYFFLNSDNITEATATSNDLRQSIFIGLHFILFIIAAIYFIRWFRRAYFNLHLLDSTIEHEESMASYGWMIPFINLWRPFSIMKEIWTKTQEHAKFEIIESTTLIGIWWTLWITNSIITNVASRLPMDTLEGIKTVTVLFMVTNVAEFIALALIIIIVKRVAEYEYALYNMEHQMSIEDHLIDGV